MKDNALTLLIRFGFYIFLFSISLMSIIYVRLYTEDARSLLWISAFCGCSIFLSMRLALFRSVSDNSVRMAAISASSIVTVLLLQNAPLIQQVAIYLSRYILPDSIQSEIYNDSSEKYAALFATLLMISTIYLILRWRGTDVAMGVAEEKIEGLLPQANDRDHLETLKKDLLLDLEKLNHASAWSDADYVPLEAQVQIVEGGHQHKRIMPLRRALKGRRKPPLAVILGDPGSGKSVALRKLSRDLMSEFGSARRMPVYINLKHWKSDEVWTKDNPPTDEELDRFVFNSLRQRVGQGSEAFLRQYFIRLRDAGFFYFIFDSFDEIPAVLDVKDGSWLIQELSAIISRYVLGTKTSRGIIASRKFRQPHLAFTDRRILELRPFTELQISNAISKMSAKPDYLTRGVLIERSDLGALARNPFLLSLIIKYFNDNLRMPANQLEMFESFFDQNIKSAAEQYGLDSLSETEIRETSQCIAKKMFENPHYGLDIPIRTLVTEIRDENLPKILDFLTRARLGQISQSAQTFSFVHRRFNEFLLVKGLLTDPRSIPIDAIQTDSKWRDALVLYAEVASEEEARRLSLHSWQYASRLKEMSSATPREEMLEGLLAIKFLTEAFRNRTHSLIEIQKGLYQLVVRKFIKNGDDIERVLVADAIGLLPHSQAIRLAEFALARLPSWIGAEVIWSLRYLPRLSDRLYLGLYRSCVRRSIFYTIIDMGRQQRILGMSDALKPVVQYLRWYRIDVYRAIGSLLICFFIAPMSAILMASFIVSLVYGMTWLAANGSIRSASNNKNRIGNDARLSINGDYFREWFSYYYFSICFFSILVIKLLLEGQLFEVTLHHSMDKVEIFALLGFNFVFMLFPIRPTVTRFYKAVYAYLVDQPASVLMKAFFYICGAVSILFALAFIIKFMIELIPNEFASLIGMGFIAILAFVAICLSANMARIWLMDRRQYKECTRVFSTKRPVIAEQLEAIRTKFYKTKYITWLEVRSLECLEDMKLDNSEWPERRRPITGFGDVDGRLARLEKRWMGIQ